MTRLFLLLFVIALPACTVAPADRVGLPRHGAPAGAPWQQIGRSALGEPIEAVTIGAGPRRVLIVGSIHGNEPEALHAIEPLRTILAQSPSRAVTVRLIRDLNPDGTRANTRGNSAGIDLNRNWPTDCFTPSPAHGHSPLCQPETRLLFDEIRALRPHLIIVFHSIRSGPFVNYDGPAERAAQRFAHAAARTDSRWHVRPSMGYSTPGSLGTFAGLSQRIPILTVEFQRGHDPAQAAQALFAGVEAVLSDAPSLAAEPS